MRLFPRFLMNTEGDNGSGGGSGGAPPAAAPAPDFAALQASIQQVMQAQQQTQQQFQQFVALQSQPRGGQEPQVHEDDLTTEERFERQLKQVHQASSREIAQVKDQLDLAEFQKIISNPALKTDDATLTQAGQVYQRWQQNGTLIVDAQGNRVRPTRSDALRFAIGERAINPGAPSPEQLAQEAERQRQLANSGAMVERPGTRVVHVDSAVGDPDAMTPGERATNYWPKLLDANGPW